ncbi:alkaline shock response membrane anchor protein AmaP [Lactococcus lactis subsp. lactis]|uniref:alkaline shock response membrane anchor protein AmaP n=1 Tax=Lactococcus lactis TaxID=1358 RepID=UPI00067E2440|nr:alkaline shock response membrane anchor protein AmaP [Lactococcus lactis]MCT3136854.1 alkaline shock response membrane anchor protein AmaP [Lactococcus lactis]TRW75430.1 alkaline shock response membrane anchor protein AmaP [Lactococcus lactis]
MATGKKIILIILDLLLLTLVLPMTWDYYNFMEYDWMTTTSSNIPFIGKYMTDYLFWGNIVLTVILILALIVILFYPLTYMDVQLTSNNGDLTLKKSAIEGFVGEKIKEVIRKEVAAMTELDVVEVNVTVTDIKTKEQQKDDDVSIQDRVTSAAQTTGKFTSEQVDKVKDKVEDSTDKEARVK